MISKQRAITVIEETSKLLLRNLRYYDEDMSTAPQWTGDRIARLEAMLRNTNEIAAHIEHLISLEEEQLSKTNE